MVLRTIPLIFSATLLAYAATAGAGPTKVNAPPDSALQSSYNKHGADKSTRYKNPATTPPDAALQARFDKNGPAKYTPYKNPATSPQNPAFK